MAGNQNSGRKPWGWYQDLTELLDKSHEIIMAALTDDPKFKGQHLTLSQKAELAARFLQKRVGEKIDLSIEHTLNEDQLDALVHKIKALEGPASAPAIEYLEGPGTEPEKAEKGPQ